MVGWNTLSKQLVAQVFQNISVYLFQSYFMSLIVVFNSVYVNGLFAVVNEFIRCIHDHLELL